MVRTAICDDEVRIGGELEQYLLDIFGKYSIKYEIDVYFSGEELCRTLADGAHYDLFFLDIMFAQNEINGVEVGKLIRGAHQNHIASIVYISWVTNYALQLFDVQPLNFLLKPLEYGKIDEVIRLYLQISGLWNGEFVYKKGHDMYKVRVCDIISVESFDRKLVLRLADGRTDEFYGSLKKEYEAQLKRYDFLYIHNSYVVNYDHISVIKYNQVLLADGTPLPVSKHKCAEVRDKYFSIMSRRTV